MKNKITCDPAVILKSFNDPPKYDPLICDPLKAGEPVLSLNRLNSLNSLKEPGPLNPDLAVRGCTSPSPGARLVNKLTGEVGSIVVGMSKLTTESRFATSMVL